MRQRVMIAMAMLTEPKILIADEFSTVLDVTIQAQILELIKGLQDKHNMGIIFVSHDLGVIAGIADNILVMSKDQIVERGSADDIVYNAKDPYTNKLLTSIPSTSKHDPFNYSHETESKTILSIKNLKTYF